jgi:hypothetical protein
MDPRFQTPEWNGMLARLTSEFEINRIRYKDAVRAIKKGQEKEDLNAIARATEKEHTLYQEGARLVSLLSQHWEGHPDDPFTQSPQLADTLLKE